MYFKLFKFMADMPYMNGILKAIRMAQRDVFFFTIIFAVVMLAYSVAFYLAFSTDIYEFRQVFASFFTLIRFVLGDFDLVRERLLRSEFLPCVCVYVQRSFRSTL